MEFYSAGRKESRTGSEVARATVPVAFASEGENPVCWKDPLGEQPNCLLGGAAPGVVACVSNAEPTEAFLAFGTFLEHVLRPHTKHQSTLPGMQ